MEWNLRQLAVFVAAVEEGAFTDAAIRLRVSQAAVSRTIAALERAMGGTLLRRVPHGCELTPTGQQLLPQVRRVLAEADRLSAAVSRRHSALRLGYAWAALGRHTTALQRDWAAAHSEVDLELVRSNTPTAGLAEGLCDVAIVRVPIEERAIESVVVGLERRVVAFASDDALWARRRHVRMEEIADREVLFDPRVGTTGSQLWEGFDHAPRLVETADSDTWLDAIAAGRRVGTTSQATAHHHARPGITYRPITDGPRIPVRLAWWRDAQPPALHELVSSVTRLYS